MIPLVINTPRLFSGVIICLLIASSSIPVGGLTGSTAEEDDLNIWSNSDGTGYRLSFDETKRIRCTGLNIGNRCMVPGGVQTELSIIAPGRDFGIVKFINGTMMSWGNTDPHDVRLQLGPDVVQIAVVHDSYSVLLKNQTVLGKDVPAVLANNVTILTSGHSHYVALTKDGNVVCWGDNTFGQCNVPSGMKRISSLSTGKYHTVARAEDGTIYCWGWNGKGQCDIPQGDWKALAVIAGAEYNLAYLENRSVLVWGSPPCNAPGPGLYSSVNWTNFENFDLWIHDSVAITDSGTLLRWSYDDTRDSDLAFPEKSEILASLSQDTAALKRVSNKDILNHRLRESIYERICLSPGSHFSDLGRQLAINRGSLRHHLAALISARKVIGMEYYGKTAFFPNNGRYTTTERQLIIHLRHPVRRDLLQKLHMHGSLCREKLIDLTEITPAVAAWHLKELYDKGIICKETESRNTKYSLNPDISPNLPELIALASA